VVHGTDDRIVGIRHARVLAEALGAPLVEVAGGGHSTIGRDPVLANLLIRRFVRSLEARS
jgi:pimeloyl-ACP methyl ester carboxylesterase